MINSIITFTFPPVTFATVALISRLLLAVAAAEKPVAVAPDEFNVAIAVGIIYVGLSVSSPKFNKAPPPPDKLFPIAFIEVILAPVGIKL